MEFVMLKIIKKNENAFFVLGFAFLIFIGYLVWDARPDELKNPSEQVTKNSI